MNRTTKRVLIAEDNPALAHVLRFNLQRAGLDVTVASDGNQAWDRLRGETYDLVVADHQMPGMTGVELLARARELDDYANTPLVMVTAKAMELDTKRLQEQLGLAAVFGKPYSPLGLMETIETLLESAC
jgi:CheY-like chemotaxis protein